jgi:hypothetical protein
MCISQLFQKPYSALLFYSPLSSQVAFLKNEKSFLRSTMRNLKMGRAKEGFPENGQR